jgi:hypothetical protein
MQLIHSLAVKYFQMFFLKGLDPDEIKKKGKNKAKIQISGHKNI